MSARYAKGEPFSYYEILRHGSHKHQPISWLPADNVSRIILDILFQKEALPPTLNVVHPKPVSWSYIISTIRDTLEKNNVCDKLPLVPWIDWMSKIEELGSGQIDEDLLQSLVCIRTLVFKGLSADV